MRLERAVSRDHPRAVPEPGLLGNGAYGIEGGGAGLLRQARRPRSASAKGDPHRGGAARADRPRPAPPPRPRAGPPRARPRPAARARPPHRRRHRAPAPRSLTQPAGRAQGPRTSSTGCSPPCPPRCASAAAWSAPLSISVYKKMRRWSPSTPPRWPTGTSTGPAPSCSTPPLATSSLVVGSRRPGRRPAARSTSPPARRHPGSSLKPFVYAQAIRRGDSPATIAYDIHDVPRPTGWSASAQPERGPVRYRRRRWPAPHNWPRSRTLEKVGVGHTHHPAPRRRVGPLAGRPDDYGLRLALAPPGAPARPRLRRHHTAPGPRRHPCAPPPACATSPAGPGPPGGRSARATPASSRPRPAGW